MRKTVIYVMILLATMAMAKDTNSTVAKDAIGSGALAPPSTKDANSTVAKDAIGSGALAPPSASNANKTLTKIGKSSTINWAKDYQTGIKKAKKLNKPVLFVISRDTCKYCVILKKTTFIDPKVVKALNKDFVCIIAQTDENDYIPRELYAPGLPALWFLYSDGTPMYQPLMGMMKSDAMLNALGIVMTEFQAKKKEKKEGKK